jgi:hypothetical protein
MVKPIPLKESGPSRITIAHAMWGRNYAYELRDAALRELKVSNNSFDFAWIEAIEQTGRHDWYEPLRRRLRIKN